VNVIETARLRMRPWNLPGDEEAAAELFCDADLMRYIPVGAQPAERVAGIVQRMIDNAQRDGFGLLALVEKESGRVVGECGLAHIPDTRDIEIAWFLARSAWRNGYATEAARAILTYAFAQLHIPRVYALIDRENARSIAVANRLGMRYDRIVRAYRRDLMRYLAKPLQVRTAEEAGITAALVATGS
jgi:ribosomal-protein-alanine N-acetyltransferase